MDFSIILSGLALLVATVNLILTVQEKKRNQKRNDAALHYVDETVKETETGMWEELNRRFDETNGKLDEISESISAYDEEIPGIKKNLQDLMQGNIPDFEEAVKAVNAVNDLNSYISNMLNYDPLEEARKARSRRRNGGEVE